MPYLFNAAIASMVSIPHVVSDYVQLAWLADNRSTYEKHRPCEAAHLLCLVYQSKLRPAQVGQMTIHIIPQAIHGVKLLNRPVLFPQKHLCPPSHAQKIGRLCLTH
jgi:hypothetical protein